MIRLNNPICTNPYIYIFLNSSNRTKFLQVDWLRISDITVHNTKWKEAITLLPNLGGVSRVE